MAMTSPLDQFLARLREVAEARGKATPGKWETDGGDVGLAGTDWGVGYPTSIGTIASLNDGEYIANYNAMNDAAFIVATRNFAPESVVEAMIEAVEAAREYYNGISPAHLGFRGEHAQAFRKQNRKMSEALEKVDTALTTWAQADSSLKEEK